MKKIFLFLLSLMISMPALWAGEVSFYFQDGEEDDFELEYPSSFVSIWNNTADELVAVPEDMGYMPYTVVGATNLKLYPNDLDYELTVSVDGNEDMYMLEQDGNEWYLTLFGEADGLEVYVRVYLAGQAPGGNNGPAEVTMAFNVSAAGGSGIADPGSLVSISYFDRTAFVNADVAIADNYGSASVVPGTSFTISPAEGYAVTDISTYSFGVASISQPGEGDKEWYVAVDESPADSFASFFITVDKASTEEPGDDRSRDASITQIEALRWKVSWNDFDFINATDSEYDRNYATLRDEAGTVTVLHANLHGLENPTVIFPDYGNYFTLNLEGLGLKDGTYTLTIPEGYVNLSVYGVSTEPCVQQTLSITIGGNVEVTYPVNITAINGNYFEITWENVTSLAEGNTTGAYIREITTGQKYDMLYLEDYYYSRANLRIDNGNVLCVNITNNYPDLPSGTYSLYLPEGYVKFNGTQTVNKAIDDHRFTYTRPWSEGRVEFDGPSADNKLTLTWVDASEILYDTSYPGDGNSITGITIFDGAETQINVAYGENITINKNVMTVDLNGLKIAAGECRILVPEECLFVTVDGETDYTYGVAFSFTYGTPDTPDTPELYTGDAIWNVKTGDTVKAGSYVEVGWGDFPLSFIDGAESASIHTFETGILYLNYGSEVTLTPDGKRIRLDLSNMPDGAFRVNVPEACVEFKVDGVTYRNQGTSMDGIIISNGSSLTDIAADATGRYRVYSLTGILVLDTTSPLDLTTLPRGIYIVNGKKVVK